jgi:hypothetical protein
MVIWGPFFGGERLDAAVRKPGGLDAVRSWVKARIILEGRAGLTPAVLWPAAALVDSRGGVLFLPERLVLRCLQAEGSLLSAAEPFVHPGLEGDEAAAFTAAALLYSICAGTPPFQGSSEEAIHQDIQEGVYLPLRFAAPGAGQGLCALVDAAFTPVKNRKGKGPGLKAFGEFLAGENLSLVTPPGGEEREKIEAERDLYIKNRNRTVNTRRFVLRNTAVIMGIAIGIAVVFLVIRSIVSGRANLPTTEGMSSGEVVGAWYNSFENLDHSLMEACVIDRAGRDDIRMVVNFYVLTKVRQAYEYSASAVIPAREWLDQGSPVPDRPVFGVTGLEVERIAGTEEGDEVLYRASYTLWMPRGGEDDQDPAEMAEPLPFPYPRIEELTLVRRKGAWRISVIKPAGE